MANFHYKKKISFIFGQKNILTHKLKKKRYLALWGA